MVTIENWRCRYSSSATPWSRVHLEKLIVVQVDKKFPALYGTQRHIIAFTKVHHIHDLSQISPGCNQFPQYQFWIILLSVLEFSNWFPTKTLYAPFCLFHTCLMTCSSFASWFDEEYKSWSCQLCSFVQPAVDLFFIGPSIFLSILLSDTLKLRYSFCLTDHT